MIADKPPLPEDQETWLSASRPRVSRYVGTQRSPKAVASRGDQPQGRTGSAVRCLTAIYGCHTIKHGSRAAANSQHCLPSVA
jgi:hypothetical protein